MSVPRALVVGMGIAGLSSAMRLREIGWEPVIVERATERRSPGYFVALFETGRATAQRMGVLDAIGDRTDLDGRTFDVDRSGTRRRRRMGYGDLPGSPTLVMRGDVEEALYEQVAGRVEIRYGTTPVVVVDEPDGVDVTLRSPEGQVTERFDLVVGADGLRSTVRRLAFGPDAELMRPLDHIIGATVLEHQLPGFDPTDGVVLAEAGRAAWVFPFTDRPPGLMFSYRTSDVDAQFRTSPVDALRAAFGPEPLGPVLENLLQQYEAAPDRLFDSVHQVEMPTWHSGRVVVVGDAAWCLTLYSGMGVSLGMAGADLLGTVLARNPGQVSRALREWEQRLRPFVVAQQRAGRSQGLSMFVPQGRGDLVMSRVVSSLVRSRASRNVLRPLLAAKAAEKSLDVAAP